MVASPLQLASLPSFPSSKALATLSPSQYATLMQHISSTLLQTLSLPNSKLSPKSHGDFVASYARDGAYEQLSALIFSDDVQEKAKSRTEILIRKRVFMLVNRLASTPNAGGINLQVILDISIVYGPGNSEKVRKLIDTAVSSNPTVLSELKDQGIPAFTRLLNASDSGLHGLRKTIFCLACLLYSSPPTVLSLFALNTEFVLALAHCYDYRLSSLSASYGGINLEHPDEAGWEKLWIDSKVAVLDCFHIVLQHILRDVRNNTGVEYAFDLIFSLLHLPSTSSHSDSSAPFLDRPLITDYQQAYSLSSTLISVLTDRDDARLDLLDAALRGFETVDGNGGAQKAKGLKLLLSSSGVMPGIDNRGTRKWKGKGRITNEEADPSIDLAVSKVLDIFPDQSPVYIRALLSMPAYAGDAERIIGDLLEGSAPTTEMLALDAPASTTLSPGAATEPAEESSFDFTRERRNVFDGDEMKVENLTIGKRRTDADAVLQDRTFMEHMKADLLRRVEEMQSDSDAEAFEVERDENGREIRIVAFEEELDDGTGAGGDRATRGAAALIAGDGERSGDESNGSNDEPPEPVRRAPETILELAYIEDPKLFDRDAATRRSKSRADLKAQTGWGDEQIEGWRIMLERNPKKDKILQKHEFAGNFNRARGSQPLPVVETTSGGHGARGRGRGRGGRGAGRGQDAPHEGNEAKDRAWKDKNKASRANHNRKRGRDRKMARGGGGAPE